MSNFRELFTLIIATIAILGFSYDRAHAVPLIVSFDGSLSSVPAELASAFTVGQSALGSFVIDSSTPDSDPDLNRGLYIGPTNFDFLFGSYAATAAGGTGGDSVVVRNPSTFDSYGANAVNPVGADVDGYFLVNLGLYLEDPSATVFGTDGLPTSLNLANFDTAVATLTFQHQTLPSRNVAATVSSLQVVPEPGTLLLLGSGLAGLAGLRRKFKKHNQRQPSIETVPRSRPIEATN